MAHGNAEGSAPTRTELGTAPEPRTGGWRHAPEEVPVATGDRDVRVTSRFRLDDDQRECVLEFSCRFPADADSHGTDWAKAALAEMALRDVLAGESPYKLPADYVLGMEAEDDTAEG